MKLLQYQKWTKRQVNYHSHGFIQEINSHYISIKVLWFGGEKRLHGMNTLIISLMTGMRSLTK
ncbi:MAG: hypothetical protein ACI9HU_000638 [Colwellia sp.]|jgi:hypothetical protein